MSETDEVHQAVEETIRRLLSSDRISYVRFEEDQDQDGDPLLRITVVCKSAPAARDAQKIIRLIGELRSLLKKLNTESFPILSFITKSEAAKLQLATT